LMTVLAAQASQARRYDLLARVVREGAANAWAAIVHAADLDIPPDSAAWSDVAIQPDLWGELPIAGLIRLYERLRQPLPPPTAERLLASKAWRSVLDTAEEKFPPVLFSSIAILVPASLRAALRADLAHVPADLATRALNAMSLLDLIEAA
jgi:hypothetical protein